MSNSFKILRKDIEVADTPVFLDEFRSSRSILLQSYRENVGILYLGMNAETAIDGEGISLEPGDSITFDGEEHGSDKQVMLFKSIYVSSTSAGDRILIAYVE